jgi:hypothetical protein
MTKKEKIIDLIREMNKADAIALHNEYCYNTNGYDDEILDIDRLDEICAGQDAYWMACRIFYGDFNPAADYFKFNEYGNIQSIFTHNVFDYIDEYEISSYIIENDNDLYNDDIRYILDDIEEE